jgi:polyribonucleotide nucleotidyltransferase
LTSRLIDRPLRPLFPEGWFYETQVVATVLSHDQQQPTEPLAQIGASMALMLSDIPWNGPVAGVQIARVDGQFVAWPSMEELGRSDMDINLVASREAIVMVESELTTSTRQLCSMPCILGIRPCSRCWKCRKRCAGRWASPSARCLLSKRIPPLWPVCAKWPRIN